MSRTMVAGSFAVAALMLLVALSQPARPAFAAFHCMRIHAVMGGFNTNDDVQFVELRMNLGGQTLLNGHKLRFFDAGGTMTGEFTFPGNVGNGSTGDSILIATAEYNNDYSPGHDSDFEFSLANTTGTSTDNRLHPVQSPGGKVVFGVPGELNCNSEQPLDSVAYGSGAVSADYGTKAVALPSPSTNQGLRLSNLSTNVSDNSAEYSLQNVSSTSEMIAPGSLASDFRFPRNNARVLSAVFPPPPVGGDVSEPNVPEQQPQPIREEGDDGVPVTPIVAVGAAVLVSAIALGMFEVRRRRRA